MIEPLQAPARGGHGRRAPAVEPERDLDPSTGVVAAI